MKTFDELLEMSDEDKTKYRKHVVSEYITNSANPDELLEHQALIEEAIEAADSPLDFCGTYLFIAKSNIKSALTQAQGILTRITGE